MAFDWLPLGCADDDFHAGRLACGVGCEFSNMYIFVCVCVFAVCRHRKTLITVKWRGTEATQFIIGRMHAYVI